jgi:hypothetical protein
VTLLAKNSQISQVILVAAVLEAPINCVRAMLHMVDFQFFCPFVTAFFTPFRNN